MQEVIHKFNLSCGHTNECIDDRVHIYELRLAHDDGGPDYEYEAFSMRQEVSDVDSTNLALVVKHDSSGTTDSRMDRILLKIDVEQTERQSACTQTIDANASDTFGDILGQLGRKMRQKMLPDRYSFYRTIGCEEIPIPIENLVDSVVVESAPMFGVTNQNSRAPTLHHVTLRPKRFADEPIISKLRPRKLPPPVSSLPRRFSVSSLAPSSAGGDLERDSMRDSMGLRPELILFSDLTASQHKGECNEHVAGSMNPGWFDRSVLRLLVVARRISCIQVARNSRRRSGRACFGDRQGAHPEPLAPPKYFKGRQ